MRSLAHPAPALAIIALVACDAPAPEAETVRIRGQITYLERIALPPDAAAGVSLVETTGDGRPRTVAKQVLTDAGQVPIEFELTVAQDALGQRGSSYGLHAEITDGGTVRWTTPEAVPVRPLEVSGPVTVRVRPIDDAGE